MRRGPNLEVHIDRQPVTDILDIYLFFRDYLGKTSLMTGVDENGHSVYTVLEEGADMPPSLRMMPWELEAIVRAGSELMPPSDATVEALRDAREQRDRMLAMIERGWETVVNPRWLVSPPPEGGKVVG